MGRRTRKKRERAEKAVGRDAKTERKQASSSPSEEWRSQCLMDRPYSWLVLAAGFSTLFTQMGFITSFGLYTDALSTELDAKVAQGSFAGGLTVGVMYMMTVVGSVVYRMLGSRLCIFFGATWAVLGFLAASQAQSIGQLYAANVIIGLGFAFNLISVTTAQVDYFDRHRIFALSFQSVGGAVGSTVMPELLLLLMKLYGWRGSLLALSGACALFYAVAAVVASRRPRLLTIAWPHIFHPALFKRKTFYIMCVNCFLWGGAIYSFYFLSTKYITSHPEMEQTTAALMLTVVGVCNIGGRIASSVLSTLDCTNRLILNAVSCAMWALAGMCFQWPQSEAVLAVTGGVFGLGYGLMYPTLSPLLLELFGVEALAASQGLAWLCFGAGCLFFPWLMGKLEELGERWDVVYYCLGGVGLVAAGATAAVAVARARRSPDDHSHSYSPLSSIQDSLRDSNAPFSCP